MFDVVLDCWMPFKGKANEWHSLKVEFVLGFILDLHNLHTSDSIYVINVH